MSEPAVADHVNFEKMEAVFYQFIQLLNRLNTINDEFKQSSDSLANQINEIRSTRLASHKNAQDSVHVSSEKVIVSLMREEHDFIESKFKKMEKRFEALENVSNAASKKKKKFGVIVALVILCSVSSGFFASWLLLSKPASSLTEEQINYLRDGQMLSRIWPNLTESEKRHMKIIADEYSHSK